MTINLSRIYTRGGDQGKTSLATGDRVAKTHPRLEGYGTSDELCCLLGKIRTLAEALPVDSAIHLRTVPQLAVIQDRLFDLGTMLATPSGKEWPGMSQIVAQDITELEQWIDAFNEELEPLKSFVLPGGSALNAETHVARAVCRRFERLLCTLGDQDIDVSPLVMAYVNRLSDYLFVLSRWYSRKEQVAEYLWSQRKGPI